MYNTPGRAVAIHPPRGDAGAFFAFRSPAMPGFDYRNTTQHKRLLERVQAADDLYLDSVSQVRVRPWWHGRVALLGDAASRVSLFGDGSSLAMAGACTLAEPLAASPAHHRLAFARYETQHRTLVDPKQRTTARAASLLIRSRAAASWHGTWRPGYGRRRVAPISRHEVSNLEPDRHRGPISPTSFAGRAPAWLKSGSGPGHSPDDIP